MLCVVAPVFHKKLVPAVAVKVMLEPEHKLLDPLALIIGRAPELTGCCIVKVTGTAV